MQKLPGSKGFYDVTLSTGQQRSARDVRRSMLRKKQDPDFRRHFQNPLRHLKSAHVWKPNIEHHEVRRKFRHFLDRSHSIPCLTHDLDLRVHGNSNRGEVPPRCVIIYNKDPNG